MPMPWPLAAATHLAQMKEKSFMPSKESILCGLVSLQGMALRRKKYELSTKGTTNMNSPYLPKVQPRNKLSEATRDMVNCDQQCKHNVAGPFHYDHQVWCFPSRHPFPFS